MPLKEMSFLETGETRRVNSAIRNIAQQFSLREYSYGFDLESEDVLVFFPTNGLEQMGKKEEFLSTVKEIWAENNFDLKEECNIKAYTYLNIAFDAIFFRIHVN